MMSSTGWQSVLSSSCGVLIGQAEGVESLYAADVHRGMMKGNVTLAVNLFQSMAILDQRKQTISHYS